MSSHRSAAMQGEISELARAPTPSSSPTIYRRPTRRPGTRRSGTAPDYLADALGLSRRGAATDGEGDRLLRLRFEDRNATSHPCGKTVLISTGNPARG